MIELVSQAISSVPAMNSLQRPSQTSAQPSNFASQLFDVVKQAETSAVNGIAGQVPMQDVVMKVMEAERTFSTAMAIRDKVVGAYLEISRMQI